VAAYRYWATPVVGTPDAPTLLSARFPLEAEEGDALRRLAQAAHPFLLPSFKLALLLGDDEAACGGEGASLRLDEPGDVTLAAPLAVSHCGAALLDRLLSPAEALAAADRLPPDPRLDAVRAWWRAGWRAMLLKEE